MTIKPEDILPNGADAALINGQPVRKGTVAAFIANIDRLENMDASEEQKQEALATLKELAPAIIASGLPKHVVFKNVEVETIITGLTAHII